MAPSPAVNLPDEALFRDPKRKGSPGDEETLLERNSGKVALLGFSLTVGLIWTYFKGNFNERDAEKSVASSQAVNVAEINDVRFRSESFSLRHFDTLCSKASTQFPSGKASYCDFISFVQRESQEAFRIAHGHLLDRIVWKHLSAIEPGMNNVTQLPVSYLLTVLNIAVATPPIDRAASLFNVARMMDVSRGDDTVTDRNPTQLTISVAAATNVVEHLADSCQLPSEKQIIVKDKFPIRTYRKKTAAELLKSYDDAEKKTRSDNDRLSKEEFIALIVSQQVCAWGECYRK